MGIWVKLREEYGHYSVISLKVKHDANYFWKHDAKYQCIRQVSKPDEKENQVAGNMMRWMLNTRRHVKQAYLVILILEQNRISSQARP